jgi:hypothetical protein
LLAPSRLIWLYRFGDFNPVVRGHWSAVVQADDDRSIIDFRLAVDSKVSRSKSALWPKEDLQLPTIERQAIQRRERMALFRCSSRPALRWI